MRKGEPYRPSMAGVRVWCRTRKKRRGREEGRGGEERKGEKRRRVGTRRGKERRGH